MVFPELDMVVVFMGGNDDKRTSLYKLLDNLFYLRFINMHSM